MAMPCTLLDQSSLPSLAEIARRGTSVIIGAPFAPGILVTGPVAGARYRYAPASTDIMAKTAAIKAICDRHKVPLATAALHFVLAHPAVVATIPGAATAAEATAITAAFAVQPPAALWADLLDQQLIDPRSPLPR